MAWTQHRDTLPKKVASAAIVANVPVKPLAAAADKVVLCATNNSYPLGFSIATGASAGNPLAVVTEGVVKAICCASVGAGGEVGVGSTNGALGPIAGASGYTIFSIGEAQDSAAAGDTFSVHLRIRQISGAI